MRKLLIIVTLICMACSEKQALQDLIPGVYVRHIENEFSQGNDTLSISKMNDNTNAYAIIRNTTYQRVVNGKEKPPESKTEKWIALYDEKNKVLIEQKKGKIISFVPEKNKLLVGSNAYQKIK